MGDAELVDTDALKMVASIVEIDDQVHGKDAGRGIGREGGVTVEMQQLPARWPGPGRSSRLRR